MASICNALYDPTQMTFGVSRGFRWVLMALACATAWSVESNAQAFERQWHLGGGLGPAILRYNVNGTIITGAHVGAQLDATYGLTDQFNLMVELNASSHSVSVEGGGALPNRLGVWTATTGLSYTLDVLQIVPYGGVLLGASRVSSGDGFGSAFTGSGDMTFDAALALGADYQVTRSFAVGLALRGHALIRTEQVGVYSVAIVRAEYTWGY